HLLLLRGEALDGVNQVRHQIGAALILVDDLRPGGLDRFVLLLNLVVAAATRQQCAGQYQTDLERAHANQASASESTAYDGGAFEVFNSCRGIFTRSAGAG